MLDRASVQSLDQVVLSNLREGHTTEAYQHILAVMGPGLLGYLRAAARSDFHAEEIYGDVRLRLFESLPSFLSWLGKEREVGTPPKGEDVASSVRAWVYRCARNRLIDWTRRASRDNAPLLTEAAIPGLAPRLSTMIQDRQRQALVARALSELSDAERDALVLRAERGFSFREVGEVLGISAAAAKERYHRAKERLRAILGESTK